jgi:hypothetical protein
MAQFIDLCKCGCIWSTFPESQLTRNTPSARTPLERAKIFEDTPLFKNIHAETAETGQTAPPKDLKVDLHFTCFVEAPDASVRTSTKGGYSKRLIELDGSRDGPMDHGPVKNFLQVRNSRWVFETFADCLFCLCLCVRFFAHYR